MNAKNAKEHDLEVVPPIRDEVGALDSRHWIFVWGRGQIKSSRSAWTRFWSNFDLGG